MKNFIQKFLVILMCASMLFSVAACTNQGKPNNNQGGGNQPGGNQTDFADISKYLIDSSNIPLRLQYDEEAPVTDTEHEGENTWYSDQSWEKLSLPIGNGYLGANVFGRTETERIQISEKTIVNPHRFAPPHGICKGGLNNFAETFIDFGHTGSGVSNYTRYLDIKTAISGVDYTYAGVNYTREYFTSYPDKALVIRLDADTVGGIAFSFV